MRVLHTIVAGSFFVLLMSKIFNLFEESWLLVFMPLILYSGFIFTVLAAIGACVVATKWLEERREKIP